MNDVQSFFHLGQGHGHFGVLDQVLQGGRQVAVLVDVGNDEAQQNGTLGGHIQEGNLVVQVVLQGLGTRGHVLHGIVLLVPLLVHAVPRGAMLFIEMIFPLPAQSLQAVEVQFVGSGLLDDQFLGTGIGGIFALGCRRGLRFAVLAGVFLLQDRIFLQFLLDALLQGHDGQLQDLHGLNHAWSKDLSLLQPLRDRGV